MRILIHDFPGHAFPAQLAGWLGARGFEVVFSYCPGVPAGRGQLPTETCTVVPLHLEKGFERYRPARRVIDETRYGRGVGRLIADGEFDVVMSSNTPLIAQRMIRRTAAVSGAAFVHWLQDMLSIGIRAEIESRVGMMGRLPAAVFHRIELANLRDADWTVAIASTFLDQIRHWGLGTDRVNVIGNWAPIDSLPVLPRSGTLQESFGFASEEQLFLYSGTLGRKHNPDLLADLAQTLVGTAHVAVISEGEGADHLASERLRRDLPNLHIRGYLPFESLPQALADADVHLSLLEPAASRFSIPSKILTYLCAGRPQLAAIPNDNPAAQLLRSAGAGIVVEPDEGDEWLEGGRRLASDPALRRTSGAAGRDYAESHFDIEAIGARFVEVFERAVSHRLRR